MKQKIVAIIPAAGLSRRFGPGRNKQFEILGDRPLVIWALDVFENMPEVMEIIPVVRQNEASGAAELFSKHGISKVRRIAFGGPERQDSVFNGLQLVDDEDSIVLVHDGARPFPDPMIVRKSLDALSKCDGVVIGAMPKDTIKMVSGDTVESTLDRETLLAVQTPQIFHYRALRDAFEKARADAFRATDDSALVERNGGRVKFLYGDYMNIKVTTPEDLIIAEAFLKIKKG